MKQRFELEHGGELREMPHCLLIHVEETTYQRIQGRLKRRGAPRDRQLRVFGT